MQYCLFAITKLKYASEGQFECFELHNMRVKPMLYCVLSVRVRVCECVHYVHVRVCVHVCVKAYEASYSNYSNVGNTTIRFLGILQLLPFPSGCLFDQ